MAWSESTWQFFFVLNPNMGLSAGYMGRYNRSLARQAVDEYINVAETHGLTPTQLALAWCKARWHVTSTIIGATTLAQLKVGHA